MVMGTSCSTFRGKVYKIIGCIKGIQTYIDDIPVLSKEIILKKITAKNYLF